MWCKMICSGGTENVVLDYRGQSLPQLRGSGGMPFPTLLILSGQHLLGGWAPCPPGSYASAHTQCVKCIDLSDTVHQRKTFVDRY